MVLSPALNIRSARGPIYDADALAFCRTSGATARKAISDFVRGVKNLGLWNNMVCWPLRSSQNAGFGDTVHSLGGLGTFNGTRVGGPTWGANGITFDGTDDHITTGILTDYNISSMVVAVVNRAVSGTNPRIVGTVDAATSPFFYRAVGAFAGAFNGSSYSTFITPANNTWNVVSQAFGPSTLRGVINQTVASTSYTPTAASQAFHIGAGQVANYWNGSMAFVGYIAANVSQENQLALHSLCKSTLGTGLGLP